MKIEERQGTLDGVTENGILLSGTRLTYSAWFEGERLTEDLLGCMVRVLVDLGEKRVFLRRLLAVRGWAGDQKPSQSGKKGFQGGGRGRRLSPLELELTRGEGARIARSLALDRAIALANQGLRIGDIAEAARLIEGYILKGRIPVRAPLGGRKPSGESPPKTPPPTTEATSAIPPLEAVPLHVEGA